MACGDQRRLWPDMGVSEGGRSYMIYKVSHGADLPVSVHPLRQNSQSYVIGIEASGIETWPDIKISVQLVRFLSERIDVKAAHSDINLCYT